VYRLKFEAKIGAYFSFVLGRLRQKDHHSRPAQAKVRMRPLSEKQIKKQKD
jgi:hypothetical protein